MPWAASCSDLLGPMPFRYCTGVSIERARRGASTAEFGMGFIVSSSFGVQQGRKQKAVRQQAPPSALLPSALRLLPSAFCLLPSAFCLLPSAFCLLPSEGNRSL